MFTEGEERDFLDSTQTPLLPAPWPNSLQIPQHPPGEEGQEHIGGKIVKGRLHLPFSPY